MIDKKGYRFNVGMIILNNENKVFWAKRAGQKSWQFPQSGVDKEENTTQAMFRELREETGLLPEDVELIGQTNNWISYILPKKYRRKNTFPLCIGQKQKWFLLKLTADEKKINLDVEESKEFDEYIWVDYWFPINEVIFFKRRVYKIALMELAKKIDIEKRKFYPTNTAKKTAKKNVQGKR